MRTSIDAFIGSTNRKLKAFRNDCLGSVTQITAVAAIPMLLCAGAAIDTVRINREQVAFDAAVDSAALAVAADDRASLAGLSASQQGPRASPSLRHLPRNTWPRITRRSMAAARKWTWILTITGAAIDLEASHSFPTTIMSLTGIDEIESVLPFPDHEGHAAD